MDTFERRPWSGAGVAECPTRGGLDAWRTPAAMPSGKQVIGAP
jgi:hypothetical protein